MQWLADSWAQITKSLPFPNTVDQTNPSGLQPTKRIEEPLPMHEEMCVEAILPPGVWKQDPNEIKWAQIESKKRAAQMITIKCWLK